MKIVKYLSNIQLHAVKLIKSDAKHYALTYVLDIACNSDLEKTAKSD